MPERTQGYLLRLGMLESGIRTIADLADKIGVSRPSASGWVNDKIPVPSSAFERLGIVLNLDDAALGELAREAAAIANTTTP